MTLQLPIGRATADDVTASRRSSGLASSLTPAASPLSILSEDGSSNSDGLKLAVKNTFIDVEAFDCDEKQDMPLHRGGAQTCTARLSQIGRFPDAAEELETSTEADDSELSEIEISSKTEVEATPEAASMQQSFAPDVFDMPPMEAQHSERLTVPCLTPHKVDQAPEARQVMLQVPLEVAAGTAGAGGDLQVAVLDSSAESIGSCTIVDLRIVVGPGSELQVFQSPAGQVLLNACLSKTASQASADGASSRGDSSVPASPVPSVAAPAEAPREVQPPPERRVGRARTLGVPGEKKSSMVCCHWKNKGWCKYQEDCKFMHPEHKRGVGLSACKGAVAASIPSSSSPGGLSVSELGRAQQVGSSSARPFYPVSAGAQAVGGFNVDMWRHAAAALAAQMSPEWSGCAYGQRF